MRLMLGILILGCAMCGQAQTDALYILNPTLKWILDFEAAKEDWSGVNSGSLEVEVPQFQTARLGAGKLVGSTDIGYVLGGGISYSEAGLQPELLGVFEKSWEKWALKGWGILNHPAVDHTFNGRYTKPRDLGIHAKIPLNDFIQFKIGYDRSHFGYGVRGLGLSRNAPSTPLAAIEVKAGPFSLVQQFNFLSQASSGEPWDAYLGSHVFEWRVGSSFRLMVYDAVVWKKWDGSRYRGFDPAYLNPFVFYRSQEFAQGSPDNALLGIMGEWRIASKLGLYGGLVLDEFLLSEIRAARGWWANKWSVQGGVKWFAKPGMVLGAELVYVRPFTYSHTNPGQAFATDGAALALPWENGGMEGLMYLQVYRERSVTRVNMQVFKQLDPELRIPITESNNERSMDFGWDITQMATQQWMQMEVQHQWSNRYKGLNWSVFSRIGINHDSEMHFRCGLRLSSGMGSLY